MQNQKGPNLINNLSKEIICKNHFKLHWRLPELDMYVSDESINMSSVRFYKFRRNIPLKLFSVNFTSLETSKKNMPDTCFVPFSFKKKRRERGLKNSSQRRNFFKKMFWKKEPPCNAHGKMQRLSLVLLELETTSTLIHKRSEKFYFEKKLIKRINKTKYVLAVIPLQ